VIGLMRWLFSPARRFVALGRGAACTNVGGSDGRVDSRQKIDDATCIVIPSERRERGISQMAVYVL
jgi:hypothetical protein